MNVNLHGRDVSRCHAQRAATFCLARRKRLESSTGCRYRFLFHAMCVLQDLESVTRLCAKRAVLWLLGREYNWCCHPCRPAMACAAALPVCAYSADNGWGGSVASVNPWCRGRDSNPHGRLAHCLLRTACLPIPPPRPIARPIKTKGARPVKVRLARRRAVGGSLTARLGTAEAGGVPAAVLRLT
jgi:hypothetical protein